MHTQCTPWTLVRRIGQRRRARPHRPASWLAASVGAASCALLAIGCADDAAPIATPTTIAELREAGDTESLYQLDDVLITASCDRASDPSCPFDLLVLEDGSEDYRGIAVVGDVGERYVGERVDLVGRLQATNESLEDPTRLGDAFLLEPDGIAKGSEDGLTHTVPGPMPIDAITSAHLGYPVRLEGGTIDCARLPYSLTDSALLIHAAAANGPVTKEACWGEENPFQPRAWIAGVVGPTVDTDTFAPGDGGAALSDITHDDAIGPMLTSVAEVVRLDVTSPAGVIGPIQLSDAGLVTSIDEEGRGFLGTEDDARGLRISAPGMGLIPGDSVTLSGCLVMVERDFDAETTAQTPELYLGDVPEGLEPCRHVSGFEPSAELATTPVQVAPTSVSTVDALSDTTTLNGLVELTAAASVVQVEQEPNLDAWAFETPEGSTFAFVFIGDDSLDLPLGTQIASVVGLHVADRVLLVRSASDVAIVSE